MAAARGPAMIADALARRLQGFEAIPVPRGMDADALRRAVIDGGEDHGGVSSIVAAARWRRSPRHVRLLGDDSPVVRAPDDRRWLPAGRKGAGTRSQVSLGRAERCESPTSHGSAYLVPDDLATIEGPEHTSRTVVIAQACGRSALRPRRGRALGVQCLGDRREAVPIGAHLEDALDHVGLVVVNPTLDVRPAAIRTEYLDVRVAEDGPAGDVAGTGLPEHRVVRPLSSLLALQLVSECGQRQHDLVGGAVERALPVFEVEEDANSGLRELFERVRGLDRLASESRFFGHCKRLEGRARFQRVHQPQEAGTAGEFRPAYAVIDVFVLVGDRPAFALNALARARFGG